MLEKNKLAFYISLNIKKIKEKGLFLHLKKIFLKIVSFEFLVIYPISSVICLFILIIRPIIFIRFGSLMAHKNCSFLL